MIKAVLVAGAIACAFAANTAHAYCAEPTPPSRFAKPRRPEAPQKPFCATTQTCSAWEIDRFTSEVAAYRNAVQLYENQVQQYVRKLSSYVDESLAYAKCEVRSLEE